MASPLASLIFTSPGKSAPSSAMASDQDDTLLQILGALQEQSKAIVSLGERMTLVQSQLSNSSNLGPAAAPAPHPDAASPAASDGVLAPSPAHTAEGFGRDSSSSPKQPHRSLAKSKTAKFVLKAQSEEVFGLDSHLRRGMHQDSDSQKKSRTPIWRRTLHPHSLFVRCWNAAAELLVLWTTFALPIRLAFVTPAYGWELSDFATDLFFWLDILISFRTGFIHPKTRMKLSRLTRQSPSATRALCYPSTLSRHCRMT